MNRIDHTPEYQSEKKIASAQEQNSKLAVNRVITDILYSIFVLVVRDSTSPVNTILALSHTCHHWRNSMLAWPALWAFVDLSSPNPILDLFMSRSGNAPLTLIRNNPRECFFIDYLESKANIIVPRLCSLTLHLSDRELVRIQHAFRELNELSLQIRHLDIHMHNHIPLAPPIALPPLEKVFWLNIPCLQVLRLQAINLPAPLLDLPPTNLTHFKLAFPPNLPALSKLLSFLRCCPLLCDLDCRTFQCDIECRSIDFDGVKGDITRGVAKSISRLDFPFLRRLAMTSYAESGYQYIRELSSHIQISTPLLSELRLRHSFSPPLQRSHQSPSVATTTVPISFNIFEPVPSGVLSCFSNHSSLYIAVDFEGGLFKISSAPNCIPHSDPPLEIESILPRGPPIFNYLTPILDFVRSMPRITHLELGPYAWDVPWIIDIPRSFPCLHTFGLDFLSRTRSSKVNVIQVLNLLPAGLELKKLILTNPGIFTDSLADAVLRAATRTRAKILETRGINLFIERCKNIEIVSNKKGVVVVRPRDR